ncbi:MAG: hypothetical protein J6P61_09975, partial [Erysipelotrichaceae bacterium]|nr:hypothetical protein [Erysipelotrichaceae bacterium]
FIGRSYRIIKVTGLPEAFDSDSEISHAMISQLMADANGRIKKVYKNEEDYESSICSVWLAKANKQKKKLNSSIAIVIHKVVVHKKDKDEDVDITEYRATFHRDFDTSYDQEEEPYWYSHQLLKTSNDPVENEEDAIKAMKVKFSDYDFTQLE